MIERGSERRALAGRILGAVGGCASVAALVTVDSFLLDPFFLAFDGFLISILWELVLKPRRRSVVIPALLYLSAAGGFWTFSTSLYLNLEWSDWLAKACGAATGR